MVGVSGECERVEEGECDFPFAEVVAGGFSDFCVGEVVEYVVADLEAEAQQACVFAQSLLARVIAVDSGGYGSYLHA